MKIKVLGSGGWEGIPTPFCACRICESAKNPGSKDNRTRPEILVETEKGSFLMEISPDIRLQSTRFGLENIQHFLISHWHFDHMFGLYELDSWSRLVSKEKQKIFCSEKTNEWLERNFAHINKDVVIVKPFEKFELFGIKITPIPVYHMRKKDDNLKEDSLNNAFGYVLQSNRKKVTYLGDYYKLPAKSLQLVKNSDLVIADGTFLFQELFPNKPEQKGLKTDPDHLHGNQILDFAKELNCKNVIFHSITHLTEKTHEELQKLLPKNMFISFDGMEFDYGHD